MDGVRQLDQLLAPGVYLGDGSLSQAFYVAHGLFLFLHKVF